MQPIVKIFGSKSSGHSGALVLKEGRVRVTSVSGNTVGDSAHCFIVETVLGGVTIRVEAWEDSSEYETVKALYDLRAAGSLEEFCVDTLTPVDVLDALADAYAWGVNDGMDARSKQFRDLLGC